MQAARDYHDDGDGRGGRGVCDEAARDDAICDRQLGERSIRPPQQQRQ